MKKSKILRFSLIFLVLATLIFIFVQSMLPPAQSAEESNKVGEIVGEIIPPETPVGNYVQINIRKIAHFVEFAILGAEVAFYVMIFERKLTRGLVVYPAAMILAFFDESIQMFSGRGPAILDVWIDFSGFCASSLLIFGCSSLILFIMNRAKLKQ